MPGSVLTGEQEVAAREVSSRRLAAQAFYSRRLRHSEANRDILKSLLDVSERSL